MGKYLSTDSKTRFERAKPDYHRGKQPLYNVPGMGQNANKAVGRNKLGQHAKLRESTAVLSRDNQVIYLTVEDRVMPNPSCLWGA